jgi:hypothetical protein
MVRFLDNQPAKIVKPAVSCEQEFCDNCCSERIISITGKCCDCFIAEYKGIDYDGYVLSEAGIGGGDDIEMRYCLECGKIQGNFPIPEGRIVSEMNGEDGEDYSEDCYSDETIVF